MKKKKINNILTKTALEQNNKLVGKTIKVLIEQNVSDKDYSIARTSTLKTVKIKKGTKILAPGTFSNVKITSAYSWRLEGK
ncbi:MAG: hypothetical protein COU81_00820 [Candidatus Portnoybacteria bacterium CG10_big_fil_rev_8_21_14_0_10_36_7]|uniref:TRAM domain-containing protein n=1 Tax=Candidatus Portnoybacteria bacterium CG10_big_fil_rev_8_21_14_0_10_36_7 TaxID=1974812 RepID=A0A2M8KEV5_9BACT|nr:MAG: hypothetical protein COU81_00820 [Candidatus Portnoybacteria bacterium CG10_big_fil_rev_8_21_14_0_10_36_7]